MTKVYNYLKLHFYYVSSNGINTILICTHVVFGWKCARPNVCKVFVFRHPLVAPREESLFFSGLARELPLGLRWQPLANVLAVRDGVVPGDVNDGM
jgi:hypothetical protein